MNQKKLLLTLALTAIATIPLWAQRAPNLQEHQIDSVESPDTTDLRALNLLAQNREVELRGLPTSTHSYALMKISQFGEEEIYTNALEAAISPDGSQYAVATGSFEIHLITPDGELTEKLPGFGASPVYSPDGKEIAYIKLTDEDPQAHFGLPTLFQGVAVYNLENRSEKLIVQSTEQYGEEDFGVAGWSSDGRRIFIVSARNPVNPDAGATWSVSPNGTDLQQLTNLEPLPTLGLGVPFLSRTAIWSTDNSLALFEDRGGIWAFQFTPDFALQSAYQLSPGKNLRLASEPGAIEFESSDSLQVVHFNDIKAGRF